MKEIMTKSETKALFDEMYSEKYKVTKASRQKYSVKMHYLSIMVS